MTEQPNHRHPSRRAFLRHLAQATAIAGGGMLASRALAQDAAIEALIEQNLRSDFGQGFDSASRTIQMPKSSLPTLSPATVQHTEQAIRAFEGIVAQGGWPEVAKVERMRLGHRSPAVAALRKRLMLAGDLDANAGVSDIYDSYVEAGVRRFQARHGLNVDGVVREPTVVERFSYASLEQLAEQNLSWARILRRALLIFGEIKEKRERELLTLKAEQRYRGLRRRRARARTAHPAARPGAALRANGDRAEPHRAAGAEGLALTY